MIQHCRKTLHSQTKENRLVIQIQKALWRKLEPLFSRNKIALRFKRIHSKWVTKPGVFDYELALNVTCSNYLLRL